MFFLALYYIFKVKSKLKIELLIFNPIKSKIFNLF